MILSNIYIYIYIYNNEPTGVLNTAHLVLSKPPRNVMLQHWESHFFTASTESTVAPLIESHSQANQCLGRVWSFLQKNGDPPHMVDSHNRGKLMVMYGHSISCVCVYSGHMTHCYILVYIIWLICKQHFPKGGRMIISSEHADAASCNLFLWWGCLANLRGSKKSWPMGIPGSNWWRLHRPKNGPYIW